MATNRKKYDYSEFAAKQPAAKEQGKYDFSEFGAPNAEEDQPINLFQKEVPEYEKGFDKGVLPSSIRGFKDFQEGVKQLYLSGFGQPGEEQQYTQQAQAGREQFANENPNLSPKAQAARGIAGSAPYLALPGGVAANATTLIPRLVGGAVTGGAIGASEFVPEGESRAANVAKGAVIGAAFPAIEGGYQAGKAIFRGENPAIKSEIAKIDSLLPEKEAQIGQADEALTEAKRIESEAKGQSTVEIGKSEPNRIEYDIGQKNKQIGKSQYEIGELEKQIEEHKNLPQLPEVGNSHITNLQNAEHAVQESESFLNEVNRAHGEAKNNLTQAEQKIGEHLNVDAQHDVEIAALVKPKIEQIEAEGKAAFGRAIQNAEAKNIQIPMPELEKFQLDENKILERLKAGADPRKVVGQLEKEAENPFLNQVMQHAPTSKDVNAKDFITKYRDFKQGVFQLTQRLKTTQFASERDQIITAINQAKKIESSSKEAIKSALGDDYKLFEDANKIYSEVIHPLRNNKVAQQFVMKGTGPDNIGKALRGPEKGNTLVRNLIKSDPEALKHVVGQRLTASPGTFYKSNPHLVEYGEHMPEFKQLLREREMHAENVEKTKENIGNAETRHKEIQSAHTEAMAAHKTKESERKSIESEKGKREKEKSVTEEKLSDQQKIIDENKKSINDHKKHMDVLREKANKRNISLQQKMKLEKEYSKMKEEKKVLEKNLHDSKGVMIKLGLAGKRIGMNLGKKAINVLWE
jgi:hypothetical protein